MATSGASFSSGHWVPTGCLMPSPEFSSGPRARCWRRWWSMSSNIAGARVSRTGRFARQPGIRPHRQTGDERASGRRLGGASVIRAAMQAARVGGRPRPCLHDRQTVTHCSLRCVAFDRRYPPYLRASSPTRACGCSRPRTYSRITTSSAGHGGPERSAPRRSRSARCPFGSWSPGSQRCFATTARTSPRQS